MVILECRGNNSSLFGPSLVSRFYPTDVIANCSKLLAGLVKMRPMLQADSNTTIIQKEKTPR